jgi:uncharacterized membrane-anchored protein YhcB (DUF1043 family)
MFWLMIAGLFLLGVVVGVVIVLLQFRKGFKW